MAKTRSEISSQEFRTLDADAQVATLKKLSKSEVVQLMTSMFAAFSIEFTRLQKKHVDTQQELDRILKRTGEIEDEMNRVLNENERLEKIIELLITHRTQYTQAMRMIHEAWKIDVQLAELGLSFEQKG